MRGCGEATDLLIRTNLVEQIRQYGRISNTTVGHFNRPDIKCFVIAPPLSANVPFACRAMEGAASQVASGLNQIVKGPLSLRALLYAGQFFVQ